MTDLEKAKNILINNNNTCVLVLGDTVYSSSERGVKPLLDFLVSKTNFKGFSAADKTIGAGAAHLYLLLGVKTVWAKVISQSALDILKSANIKTKYETLVPYIINRKGDGMCPIEKAVKDITNSNEALNAINATLEDLKVKN